jgi:hypothetical protein
MKAHQLSALAFTAGLLLAACGAGSSPQESDQADTSPIAAADTTATSVLATPPTPAAQPPATTVQPDINPAGLAEHLSWAINEQGPEFIQFTVTDRSERHVGQLEALPFRDVIAQITFPAEIDQVASGKLPVSVTGVGRRGSELFCGRGPVASIEICVGFPRADQLGIDGILDLPNHPGDISAVLDVLWDEPELSWLSSRAERDRVAYRGGSMGGFTGLYLLLPDLLDPRIALIDVQMAFAPETRPAFADKNTWDSGPPVLLTVSLDDPVINYEQVARTVELSGGSTQLTVITIFEGGHMVMNVDCPAAWTYKEAWYQHHMLGGPPPDPSVFVGSSCAQLGIVTTGR